MTKYLYTFELWALNILVQTWRQTTYEVEGVTHNGQAYARTNISHGALSLNAEKSAGTLDIYVLRDHPIAQRFLTGYPSGSIRITIHEVDDNGTRLAYAGKVRACAYEELRAKLTCTDTLNQLQHPTPRLKYAPPCPWDLYGPDCGVNRTPHARTGTVTSVSTDGLTIGTTLHEAADFFAAGYLDANGQTRLITESTGTGTLSLFAPIDGLQEGNSITAYRGCNRSITDCKAKFDNVLNYGGQHHNVAKNIFYNGLN